MTRSPSRKVTSYCYECFDLLYNHKSNKRKMNFLDTKTGQIVPIYVDLCDACFEEAKEQDEKNRKLFDE